MGHKIDKRGRDANSKYVKMPKYVMDTPAYRALTPKAKVLYLWLKMEDKGPRSKTNGRIRLSYRQAAERVGVAVNTVGKAFEELQEKGFIVVRQLASLGLEGDARGPCYELTELPMPGKGKQPLVPRHLYREWSEDKPFEVLKHKTNNPKGLNGKSKNPSKKWG